MHLSQFALQIGHFGDLLLQAANLRSLRIDFSACGLPFPAALHLIQQHRREFVITHALDRARLIADYEFGIHLGHFLGDQSVLHRAFRDRSSGESSPGATAVASRCSHPSA